jgi:octaprenyl-diphosphate synthase
MSALTDLYEPIAIHLGRVETVFQEALGSSVRVVDELCHHVGTLRGKMLRPVLLLLSGEACGGIRQEHYCLAAAIEMVHMATLVHDDVLDEADVRRNAVTVNRMTTNETAVMLGDFLFSRAFVLCTGIDSQRTNQMIGQAVATVCEGELLQLSHRGDFRLTEDLYFTIIDRKTAALTAVACEIGALHADAAPEVMCSLREYGRSVGIAFQIADDILDIAGREEQTGKTLGTDARKGKLTLPMIHHLRTCSNGSAGRLLEHLQAPEAQDRAALQRLLVESGSLEYARRIAREHVSRAVASLECLPAGPARTQLQTMAEFIVGRQF